MPPDTTTRQEGVLDRLAQYVEQSADIGAMVVLGSFAKGTADALSDLDLFFITHQDRFQEAWERRRDLHVTGAIVHWDHGDEEGAPVAGHRWLSPDLVLVESVISAPQGGGRLAEPLRLVAGDSGLVESFPRRPTVTRTEITDINGHPVNVAYDGFKRAVRNASRT